MVILNFPEFGKKVAVKPPIENKNINPKGIYIKVVNINNFHALTWDLLTKACLSLKSRAFFNMDLSKFVD